MRKKPEIIRKLNEPDGLRRTVEALPPEILQAAKQRIAYKPQEK